MAEPAGRALLLGDLPAEEWARLGTGEPWVSFGHAAELVQAGNIPVARQQFYSIVTLPHLPTRHYLQAWKGLRELGETPNPKVVRLLYAVVLDVPMESGWDTLAVYRDYSCHYQHHSGRETRWRHPDDSLDQLIDALLAAARPLAAAAAPCGDPRSFPGSGRARLTLLCAGGAFCEEAGIEAVLETATRLLHTLVELTVG